MGRSGAALAGVNGKLPPDYLVISAHAWRVMLFENACGAVIVILHVLLHMYSLLCHGCTTHVS